MSESTTDKLATLETDGHNAARRRRAKLCQNGRGDTPPCRPTGRVRPKVGDQQLAKVQMGTTLSGQAVTGTQVERNTIVTGNEPGTCSVVTGTEYIGAEQFETFCPSDPEQFPVKVTGDMHSTSRSITGSEYTMSAFARFSESKRPLTRPDKASAATGGRVTGRQYSDIGFARLTINGPSKVALTHTLAGRPVSGTELGQSIKVTGDEAGSCLSISGIEYLSNEQFTSICNVRPETAPAKVGVDVTQGGSRVTGNMVNRGETVTGDEAGSCQRITGAQYRQTALCGGGAEKVSKMLTLAGRTLTGTRVDHGPNLTGDEHGVCQAITGTEYFGRDQFAAYCPEVPAPAAAKVGISQSGDGLPVSGTMLGRSAKVTGNEPGSSLTVSGTPYAGREQMASGNDGGCSCREPNTKTPMETSRPAPLLSGRRYLAPADQPMQYRESPPLPSEQPRPEDFSILSPAREALTVRERITGTAYGAGGRITGPVNMAAGLISGTPEFRYRDDPRVPAMPRPHPDVEPIQQPTLPTAPTLRITGAGSEAGSRITGDGRARD